MQKRLFFLNLEKQLKHMDSADNMIFRLITDWLKQQFSTYYQRIETEPEAALVETIPSISCRCDDCKEIVNFMSSKKEDIELARLKVKCEHLAEQIEQYKVQASYNINKRRRPWRFNMRKIGAEQRDKIVKYKIAKDFIERLEKL